MPINETIISLVDQAIIEIGASNVSFTIKFLAILGFFWCFSLVAKLSGDIVKFLIYIYAFIKYIVYKVRGKII